VYNQLVVSLDPTLAAALKGNSWVKPVGMPASMGSSPEAEAAFFYGFFVPNFYFNGKRYINTELSIQAPYTPTRSAYDYVLWQANDPLVHYVGSDLTYVDPGIVGWHQADDFKNSPLPTMDATSPGKRYQPWGLNKQMAGLANVDTNAYNLAFKDPVVWCPDNWDFPTNKYPSVGWIGRVHRGTPWQTVYLKSPNELKEYAFVGSNTNYIGTNTWAEWTGDTLASYGHYFDAANSAPAQDRMLFDLFTTAPNENATRGQLSVNVDASNPSPDAGLPAWSALFSGMVVLSNNATMTSPGGFNGSYTVQPSSDWTNISPAGVDAQNSVLWQIVTNINATRALFPDGAFPHAGDVLSAPLLSDKSPFLNWRNVDQQRAGISDQMYEWLPQQMMSLLSDGSPQYVVYAYGQALRPAPGGTYLGSWEFFGMVTNYQIVSETVTRSLVRFETTRTNKNDGTISVTPPRAVLESFNVLPPD
jgi:hypothetical protein